MSSDRLSTQAGFELLCDLELLRLLSNINATTARLRQIESRPLSNLTLLCNQWGRSHGHWQTQPPIHRQEMARFSTVCALDKRLIGRHLNEGSRVELMITLSNAFSANLLFLLSCTADSKSAVSDTVRVRVPPSTTLKRAFRSFFVPLQSISFLRKGPFHMGVNADSFTS